MRSASTRPPANPASDPQSVPMATATKAELKPTVKLKIPPARSRASMSRPLASVPRRRPGTYDPDSTAARSRSASSGARSRHTGGNRLSCRFDASYRGTSRFPSGTEPNVHGTVSTHSAATAASIHQPNRAQRRCERSIPEVYGLPEGRVSRKTRRASTHTITFRCHWVRLSEMPAFDVSPRSWASRPSLPWAVHPPASRRAGDRHGHRLRRTSRAPGWARPS